MVIFRPGLQVIATFIVHRPSGFSSSKVQLASGGAPKKSPPGLSTCSWVRQLFWVMPFAHLLLHLALHIGLGRRFFASILSKPIFTSHSPGLHRHQRAALSRHFGRRLGVGDLAIAIGIGALVEQAEIASAAAPNIRNLRMDVCLPFVHFDSAPSVASAPRKRNSRKPSA